MTEPSEPTNQNRPPYDMQDQDPHAAFVTDCEAVVSAGVLVLTFFEKRPAMDEAGRKAGAFKRVERARVAMPTGDASRMIDALVALRMATTKPIGPPAGSA